jgi:hypothetical protein
MKRSAIIIAAVIPVKSGNGNVRLELHQEVNDEKNVIGALLGKNESKKRITWVTVEKSIQEKMNFQVGDDFSAKFGQKCDLRLVQTVNPRGEDAGKYNMQRTSKDGGLCKDASGKQIYRYIDLAPAGTQDVLVPTASVEEAPISLSVSSDESEA